MQKTWPTTLYWFPPQTKKTCRDMTYKMCWKWHWTQMIKSPLTLQLCGQISTKMLLNRLAVDLLKANGLQVHQTSDSELHKPCTVNKVVNCWTERWSASKLNKSMKTPLSRNTLLNYRQGPAIWGQIPSLRTLVVHLNPLLLPPVSRARCPGIPAPGGWCKLWNCFTNKLTVQRIILRRLL